MQSRHNDALEGILRPVKEPGGDGEGEGRNSKVGESSDDAHTEAMTLEGQPEGFPPLDVTAGYALDEVLQGGDDGPNKDGEGNEPPRTIEDVKAVPAV
mmetsp:Transcript_37467/g.81627  ORF Transcript_37467/g.81627 Transcript_37467/m.81627 type:complete len:98 (-) Transcript_37467:235-528(-)